MEIPLTDLKEGAKARVVRITGGFGMQQHLVSLGVKEGSIILRVAAGEGHGPVMFETDGNRVAIGRGMARRVIVSEIDDT